MIRQLFGNRSSSLFIPRIRLTLAGIGLLVVGAVAGLGSLAGPLSGSASATSGINKTFNFQGRLLTATGAVVADGNYNMRFRIYQDGAGTSAGNPGGTLMWTELWQNSVATGSSTGVVVKNGYFSVNLASYCAFSGGSCQGNTNSSVDFNQDTLWLSMDVAGTAVSNTPTYDGEMLPMRRLASAVYSLQADNANKLGGLTSTQYLQLAQGVQADSSTTNASIFVNKTGATANILDLQRGGADVMLINNAGQSLFRPTTDSQTALQVQKAGTTTTAFTVDTSNSRIGIGLNNPAYAVDAVGSVNASVSVKVAGTDVCTTSGCTASSASAILNQTSQQSSSNFNISGVGVAATAFQAPLVQTTDQSAASTNSASLVIRSGNAAGTTSNSGDVTLDVGTATGTKGTLNIGTSNAVNVNIATNGAAHTIALGTGAAVQGITIGSTNTTSALTLNAGSGNVNIQATTVLGVASGSDGTIILKNATNANTLTLVSGATSTSYTTKLPAAIGATNQCLTVASVVSTTQTLGYGSCTAGTVTLQGTTPGTPDTGNINISGTGIFGTQVTSPILKTTNIRPTTDGTNAIQFQNAAGSTTVMAVDTTNSRIKVGTIGTAVGQVYVSGNLPASAIGSFCNTCQYQFMVVQGKYAYVATYSGSLVILDISNPASITQISSTATTLGNVWELAVSGRYVYAVGGTSGTYLNVFDVSNPTSPTIVGSLSAASTQYDGLNVSGRYLYMVGRTHNNTMRIVDISNPVNPTVVSTVATATTPYDVAVQGNYAYVVAQNTSGTSFQSFDVSDPAKPALVGSIATGSSGSGLYQVNSLAVNGRYAYVVNGGTTSVRVVDISNPTSPSVVGGGGTYGTGRPVIQGRLMYIGDYNHGWVEVFDISSPTAPSSIGNIAAAGNMNATAVQGRYLYTSGYFVNPSFTVHDLGGTYDQQLEAGGITTSTLNVDGDAVIGGSLRMQGSIGTAGVQAGTVGTNSLNVATTTNAAQSGMVIGAQDVVMPVTSGLDQQNNMEANQFTTGPTGGTVSYLNAYVGPVDSSGNDQFQMAIYNDSSNAPGTKLVNSATQTLKPYSWNTVAITPTTLSANTSYWIAYNQNSFYGGRLNGVAMVKTTASGTYYKSQTFGTYPSPFGSPGGSTGSMAVFASTTAPTPNYAAQVQNASGVQVLAVNAGDQTVGIAQLTPPTGLITTRSANTPTVANIGTAGSTSYSYSIAPVDTYGNVGQSSPVQTTATGNATLGASNYNRVTLPATSGNVVSYNVYRTASSGSPSTTGLIGNTNSTTFNDQAVAVKSTLIPATTNSLTASTTYYYQITALDANGGESTVSSEVSQATGTTGRAINLSWSASRGARGYKIYRSTTSGSETYLGTTSEPYFIDDGSITATALTAPGVGTGYSSRLGYGSTQLTVGSGEASGQVFVGVNVPSAPFSTTQVGQTPDAVAVQGRYAYVGNYTDATISVYDVSDPARPQRISTVATNSSEKPNFLTVQGKYLYIAGDNGTLQIYDISNPASITFASTSAVGTSPESVYVSGRYAYVIASGSTALVTFDVSNVGAPTKLSTVATGSGAQALTVSGRYAYVVNSTAATLGVYDLANPALPVLTGTVSISSNSWAVSVQGRYAYLASSSGLQIVDVSNPAVPYVVSSFSPAFLGAYALVVQGRYVYMSNIQGGLIVIDVSNPAVPVDLGYVVGKETPGIGALVAQGRYVYQAAGTTGYLHIYDMGGTFTQGLEAGSIETSGLSVRGNSSVAGDLAVNGAATVGQGLNVNGDIAASGAANFKGTANSATAFQIQNPSGNSLVNVSTQTTEANLWPNPSFETSANGVAQHNTATIDQSAADVPAKFGSGVMRLVTNGNANSGAEFRYPFKGSTTYSISMWIRRDVGSAANVSIGWADNGSDTDCATGLTASTTWTQITCTAPFTTGTTIGAASNFYVKISAALSVTFYIDGVTLVAGSTPLSYALPPSALQVEPYYNNISLNAGYSGEIQPWQQNANPLPAVRSRPAVTTANGFVYVMGGGTGVDGVTPQNTVYYAKVNGDGSLGSWTTNANNLGTAVAGSGAVVLNGYVYLIGGSTGALGTSDTALVQYAKLNADGSTGTWSTTTQLPAARDVPAVAAANGAIQVVGGNVAGTSQLGTLYARPNADGTINRWITGTNMTYSRENFQIVVSGGYVYAVSGANANGFSTEINTEYAPINSDGSMGAWSGGPALTAGRGNQPVLGLNGYIYTLGGWDGGLNATGTVYYAPMGNGGPLGSWSTSTNPLPIVHATAARAGVENNRGVVVNGYMYSIGGDDTSAASARVFYASGPRLKVSGSLDLTNGAKSLNDISSGGNLTAGSTAVLGTLMTADNASFLRNVNVTGNLNVGGQAAFQTSTNSANAFTVQTTSGTSAVNVSTLTTDANLWSNPSFEANINGVTVHNGATSLTQDSVDLGGSKFGLSSVKLVSGAVANNGAEFRTSFKGSTTYSLNLWARTLSTTASNVNIGRADNGTDADCLTGQTVTSTWTRYTCSFTTGTTIGASSAFYFKVNSASSNTFYIDGVTLVASSTPLDYTLPGSALQVEPYYNQTTFNALNNGEIQPWQQNPNPLPAVRSRPAVATANGYAYVMGGGTGGDGATPQSTVYYAKANGDGTLGSWTTNANALGTAVAGAGATVMNGYIYVIGGATGAVLTSDTALVQYARLNADGSTGAWSTTTPLPAARDVPGVTSANGAIQVIGGNVSGATVTSTLYARPNVDGTINNWIAGTTLVTTHEDMQPVLANGNIYIVGGNNSNGAGTVPNVEYAPINSDGSMGSWISSNPLPTAVGNSATVALNGYLYQVAGYETSVNVSTVRYAPLQGIAEAGVWTTSTNSLPVVSSVANASGLENHRSLTINGYIYTFGGENASGVVSRVYYTSGARTKINGSLDLTNAGRNLTDGPTGGSLTAGNTQVVGSLNVAGDTNLNRQLTVNGGVTVGGPATFSSTTASPGAFQVQDASSVAQVNVNTSTANNLISNPSFEMGNTNGWFVRGGANMTDDQVSNFGRGSLQFVTGTSSGNGIEYRVAVKASTTYSLSFFIKRSTGSSAALSVGVNPNPATPTDPTNDANCTTTPSSVVVTTTWMQVTCSFTTGATIAKTSNIYIKQSDSVSDTLYLDGVTLVQSSTPLTYSTNLAASGLQVDTLSTNLTINANNNIQLQPWRLNPNPVANTAGTVQPRGRAAVATANGYVYVMGGGTATFGGTVVSSNTVLYAKANADGTLGGWTNNTNNLSSNVSGAGGAVVNGYVYVVGGSTAGGSGGWSTAVTTVQYARLNADGSTGTWTTTTGLPAARYNHGVVAYNGYIYVIAGSDTTGSDNATIYYGKVNADGTVSSWTTNATPLTNARGSDRAFGSGSFQPVVANGTLYIPGGKTVNTETFLLNKDGSATNHAWAPGDMNDMPGYRDDGGAAVLNGYLYVLPAYGNGSANTSTYASEIVTDQTPGYATFAGWTTLNENLPVATYDYKSVVVNGYIYILAGETSAGVVSSVYYTSAARTQIAGSLDLVGITGKNMAEGGTGGTLTAGNTSIVGTLNVQDAASFNNNMTVMGQLAVGGNVAVKTFTNSATAFTVQNASGTAIFTVDTNGSTLTIGSSGNTVTFASTGEPTLAGTARHAKSLVISPEYPGAVLDAASDTGGSTNCSTTNNGTMTSGYTTTGRQSYYNWISTQGSAQCYDIVLQVQLPSDWAAWNGQSSMMVYNSSGTDSTSVMVNVIDTSGTNDANYSATAYNGVSSGTTFASTNLTAYSGTYAADGYMTLKIRLTSSSSKNVRVGNITLNYLSKF